MLKGDKTRAGTPRVTLHIILEGAAAPFFVKTASQET